jgi:hypothetical protein
MEIILKNYDEVLRKKLISQEGTGIIFVFCIQMVTDDPINQQRDFLLKYYLDDTKFGVYEVRHSNSGKFKRFYLQLSQKLKSITHNRTSTFDKCVRFN